ncbi:MAG: flagellar hook-basal body complex protein FliE [Spartobacteria bacterium]|nr:flagellar hook-basal body complex protein FliE [Spartobacteria bacterium]
MEPISYSALKINSDQMEIAPHLQSQQVEKPAEGMSFGDLMGRMIDEVDHLQKASDQATEDLVTGRRNDVHNVAVMMDESGVAFDLLLQIRNKMVEGFKEISRMQA